MSGVAHARHALLTLLAHHPLGFIRLTTLEFAGQARWGHWIITIITIITT
jgi:hypothetical protein